MTEIILDFYGDIADYRKIEETVNKIREIKGCTEARTRTISEERGYSKSEKKMHFILAGYSQIITEWVSENKDFLIALAAFLISLLKKPEHKIVINKTTTINFGDDIDIVVNKINLK